MPATTRRRKAKAADEEGGAKEVDPRPLTAGTNPAAAEGEQGGKAVPKPPRGRGRRKATPKESPVKAEPSSEETEPSAPESDEPLVAPGPTGEGLAQPVLPAEEAAGEPPEEAVAEATAASGPSPAEPGPPTEAASQPVETGFGWLIWDGERYDFDVVVHADRHVSRRQKALSRDKKEKYGHTPLTRKELALMEGERPEVVIIGIGQYGNLPLTPKAEKWLNEYQYFIGSTPEALKRLKGEEKRAVAILHVTC